MGRGLGRVSSQKEGYCKELKAMRKHGFSRHMLRFLLKEESIDMGELRHGAMKKSLKMEHELKHMLDLIDAYRPKV